MAVEAITSDDPLTLEEALMNKIDPNGLYEKLQPDFEEPISLLQLCTIFDAVDCVEVRR